MLLISPLFIYIMQIHRWFKNWIRVYIYQHSSAADPQSKLDPTRLKRWERDYQLEEVTRLHLFDEYIEMSKLKCGFICPCNPMFSNIFLLCFNS